MTSRKKSIQLISILALLLACLFTEFGCEKQESKDSQEYTQEANDNGHNDKKKPVNNKKQAQEEESKKDIIITADMISLLKDGNQKASGLDWDFPVKKMQDCKNGLKVDIRGISNITAKRYGAVEKVVK